MSGILALGGCALLIVGLVSIVVPLRFLRIDSRRRGVQLAFAGLLAFGIGGELLSRERVPASPVMPALTMTRPAGVDTTTATPVKVAQVISERTAPTQSPNILAHVGADDCRSISDPKARLECFDKAPKSPVPAAQADTPRPAAQAKPEPLPERTAPRALVVDAPDLGIGSRKYFDKPIELRGVWCYYADVADYRCMTESKVVVFSKAIIPAEHRQTIETNCSELRKAISSPACRRVIRFEFGSGQIEEDTVSGGKTRTVIAPAQIEVLPNVPKRSR